MLLDDVMAAMRTLPPVDGEDFVTATFPSYMLNGAAYRKFMASTDDDKPSVSLFVKNVGDNPGQQVFSVSINGDEKSYVIPHLPGGATTLSRVVDESFTSESIRADINLKNTTKFDRAVAEGLEGGTALYEELQPSATAFDPKTGLILQPQLYMKYVADPQMVGAGGYPGFKVLELRTIKFFDANTLNQYGGPTEVGSINSLNGEPFSDLMSSFTNKETIYGEYDNVLSSNVQSLLLNNNTDAFIEEFKKQQGE
jgi:hypothetical protein